jgi:hypothetical protein
MANFKRIKEDGEPKSTAEKEYQKLLSREGRDAFNQHFPVQQVEPEIKKAEEWEAWLAEHQEQAVAEMAIAEGAQAAESEIALLNSAINFLEFCRKKREIPDKAKLSEIFIHIASLAQKLVSQASVVANSENLGIRAALKALIDLKKEDYPESNNLLDVIKDLDEKLQSWQKANRAKNNEK